MLLLKEGFFKVVLAPEYLTDEEVAAWPLAGVTAWRWVNISSRYGNSCVTVIALLLPKEACGRGPLSSSLVSEEVLLFKPSSSGDAAS